MGSSAWRRKTSARLGVASGSPGRSPGRWVTSRGSSGLLWIGGGVRWRKSLPERRGTLGRETAVAAAVSGLSEETERKEWTRHAREGMEWLCCALCSVDESPITTLLIMRGIGGAMFVGYCAPLDTLEVPPELADPDVRQEILAQLAHLLEGAA